jgi:arylsulfatase
MIERLDVNVGKLIAHLKSTGQYENTLIVFMADNGAEGNSIWGIADTKEWVANTFNNDFENIGRKNSYIFTGPSWAQVSALPFKWYKSFSTEGGVRTPMFVSYPKWTQNAGKISNEFISVMDLAPTFLELAEVAHPGAEFNGKKVFPMDGVSLLDWLEGREDYAHNPEKSHCWELYGRKGVRKGDWKAEWYDSPYGNEEWELYNIESDPGENINMALDNPEKLEELKADWEAYAKAYNITLPNEHVAYGIEEIWRKK